MCCFLRLPASCDRSLHWKYFKFFTISSSLRASAPHKHHSGSWFAFFSVSLSCFVGNEQFLFYKNSSCGLTKVIAVICSFLQGLSPSSVRNIGFPPQIHQNLFRCSSSLAYSLKTCRSWFRYSWSALTFSTTIGFFYCLKKLKTLSLSQLEPLPACYFFLTNSPCLQIKVCSSCISPLAALQITPFSTRFLSLFYSQCHILNNNLS